MYCKHCGHELNSDNICTNPECPSKTNINNDIIIKDNCGIFNLKDNFS